MALALRPGRYLIAPAYSEPPRGRGLRRGLLLLRLGAALLSLTAAVSLVVSPAPRASLPYVLLIVGGAGLVLVLAGNPLARLRRRATPERIVFFFIVCGWLGLLGFGLSTKWPIYKLSFLGPVYAALPSIRSLPLPLLAQGLGPNQAGGLMAGLTAFAVGIAILDNGRESAGESRDLGRRVAAVGLALCGTALVVLTGSRAALAGLVVSSVLMLMFRSRRWLWATASSLVLAGVVIAAKPAIGRAGIGALLRDETIETKLVARLDIWSSVLRAIQDHAFTGIGLAVLNRVLPVRYPYESVGLSFTVSHAHNAFLDTALTIGIPGLLGLLALLAGMVQLALALREYGNMTRACALGLLSSTIVFAIFGLTDSLSLSTASSIVLWMWCIGLALLTPLEAW